MHNVQGPCSLGATGPMPHFISGYQKGRRADFQKSSSHTAFIIYIKKDGISHGKIYVSSALLKYIACFNIHDNKMQ
jgi:hypothetical protein